MFKYLLGRQDIRYKKLKFLKFKNITGFIIRYPVGSRLPLHKDLVKNKKHYCINIIKPSKKGGIFYCDKSIYRNKYFVFFRSDLYFHCVTEIKEKSKYVLSICWTI